MISRSALRVVSILLSVCCNVFQFIPYTWNPETHRFSKPTKFRLWIYKIHEFNECCLWVFSFTRFLMLCAWKDVPIRSYEIHGVWLVAFSLGLVCFRQFNKKREEIMWFGNCLFSYIEQNPVDQNPHKKGIDWISFGLWVSGFLFFFNPPAHALTIVDSPCVPNFTSSLFFPCKHTEENDQPAEAKLPFWLLENYITAALIAPWSFNWAFIFLGFAWLKTELEKIRLSSPNIGDDERRSKLEKYRMVQYINVILSDSFKLYLEWFPSLLLGIVVLSLFAGLKFTNLPFHNYIMAPACASRCLFESMTALQLAGHVNQESIKTLKEWKREERIVNAKSGRGKFIALYHKSCRVIFCAAGSLYTFESTIVLVNVDLTVQAVVNLLLMSKNLK